MLRPLYLDLLDVILPLGAVGFALFGGCCLAHTPTWVFRSTVGLAVAVVFSLAVAYFTPFHGDISDALGNVGGVTTVACAAATLLLGVVWSSRGRSTSTGFLRVMVGLIGLIIVLNAGGRLWWRSVSTAAWQNAPDAAGCLTQSSGWTCAPATAAMLLHHYGIPATEGEMAYRAGTSYLGTDVPSIVRALEEKAAPNLVARGMRADYDACRQRTSPFYACIDVPGLGGHAILVLSVRADEVELIDPRFGRRQTVPRAEMEPTWQGRIVFLEPTH